MYSEERRYTAVFVGVVNDKDTYPLNHPSADRSKLTHLRSLSPVSTNDWHFLKLLRSCKLPLSYLSRQPSLHFKATRFHRNQQLLLPLANNQLLIGLYRESVRSQTPSLITDSVQASVANFTAQLPSSTNDPTTSCKTTKLQAKSLTALRRSSRPASSTLTLPLQPERTMETLEFSAFLGAALWHHPRLDLSPARWKQAALHPFSKWQEVDTCWFVDHHSASKWSKGWQTEAFLLDISKRKASGTASFC